MNDTIHDWKSVKNAEDLARMARKSLIDSKAIDVVLYDVRGLSSITDYVLLASGMAPPHLKALVGGIEAQCKTVGIHSYRQSGKPDDGWIVLDYVDVVIHVMLKEMREYYDLEGLWGTYPQLA